MISCYWLVVIDGWMHVHACLLPPHTGSYCEAHGRREVVSQSVGSGDEWDRLPTRERKGTDFLAKDKWTSKSHVKTYTSSLCHHHPSCRSLNAIVL
jgi:hypothetical protein